MFASSSLEGGKIKDKRGDRTLCAVKSHKEGTCKNYRGDEAFYDILFSFDQPHQVEQYCLMRVQSSYSIYQEVHKAVKTQTKGETRYSKTSSSHLTSPTSQISVFRLKRIPGKSFTDGIWCVSSNDQEANKEVKTKTQGETRKSIKEVKTKTKGGDKVFQDILFSFYHPNKEVNKAVKTLRLKRRQGIPRHLLLI
ncbi:hypothetical protein E3N88_08233 [Mikania micrantha]|uniref:Uncharacterized protein n=1 Tax=Mikania micrantha TaxID=192012 RepID=A0A5N6PGN4_9ASTR|nr:hypothetical protein E3N88_08233 [Mikania micrantha]